MSERKDPARSVKEEIGEGADQPASPFTQSLKGEAAMRRERDLVQSVMNKELSLSLRLQLHQVNEFSSKKV